MIRSNEQRPNAQRRGRRACLLCAGATLSAALFLAFMSAEIGRMPLTADATRESTCTTDVSDPVIPSLSRDTGVLWSKVWSKVAAMTKTDRPEAPEERARQAYQDRVGVDGAIDPVALLRAKQQLDQMPLRSDEWDGSIASAGIWNWSWLGPGNVGGRIRAVVIHPTDTATMWVGGAAGGIWKTTNAGASWQPMNDFLPALTVSCMVIEEDDPNLLYAGTGESLAGAGLPGVGVFKSTDGGVTWSLLPRTSPTYSGTDSSYDRTGYTSRLAIDPFNSLHILAATDTGVFESLDGGNTWGTTDLTDRTVDVKFSPDRANRVMAGQFSGLAWWSDDGGQTWQASSFSGTPFSTFVRIPTLPALANIEVFSSAGFAKGDLVFVGLPHNVEAATVQKVVDGDTLQITTLANVHQMGEPVASAPRGRVELGWGSGGIVYASMDVGGGTIYRSSNDGQSFSLRGSAHVDRAYFLSNVLGFKDQNTTQGSYDNTIWVDPTDNNFIVVGGIDLWRSFDGGNTMQRISDWLCFHLGTSAHADQHIVVAHPSYNGSTNRRVFVGNDGGIQTTTDIKSITLTGTCAPGSWTSLANNLGITQFYAGAASRGGSVVVGGAQDNGNLRFSSSGGAQQWVQCVNCTGDGGFTAVDYSNTNIIYTTTQQLSVWKSVDGGNTYFSATNGLGDSGNGANTRFIAPLVMDPNNPSFLLAGGTSVWRTLDGAGVWFPIRAPTGGAPKVSAIDIADGNSNLIWVGYENGRVSRTSNNVVTSWIDVDNNPGFALPNRVITDIAINPNDHSEVFVTVGGYSNDTVWFTSDGGTTWFSRNGTASFALPSIQVNTVRVHPVNGNWVYIGTDLGVFASEDQGLTWNTTPRFGNIQSEGPVNTKISELFWQGDNLVAATFGRGMWRTRPLVTVFVNGANTGIENGTLSFPFNTVREGLNAAGHGTTISIEAGTYSDPNALFFEKRVDLVPRGGAVLID